MSGIKKKIGLLTVFVWYCICVFLITPILVEYLFTYDTVLTELFAELISVGVPVTFLAMRKNKKGEATYKIYQSDVGSLGFKNIFVSIIMCIALFFAMKYINNVYQMLYIIDTRDYSIVNTLPETNWQTVIVSVLVYAVMPAVYEEILYRGLYADSFSCNHVFLLYVSSSLVFASCHSNASSILNAFFLGMVLMKLYCRFNSIGLVIVIHFFNNLLSLVFSNYAMLPFSSLMVLSDYANEEQMKAAVVISFGVSVLMIMIIVLSIKTLNKQKVDLKKACVLDESKTKFAKYLDYFLIGLMFLLATGLILLKIL